jgi:hypothetical protein
MTAGEVLIERSGPGGIHLLNGLYDAKLDHQPVLAITGLQFLVEPPWPAKIPADQALHFAESLARGELNRGKIAPTAESEKVREMI